MIDVLNIDGEYLTHFQIGMTIFNGVFFCFDLDKISKILFSGLHIWFIK